MVKAMGIGVGGVEVGEFVFEVAWR